MNLHMTNVFYLHGPSPEHSSRILIGKGKLIVTCSKIIGYHKKVFGQSACFQDTNFAAGESDLEHIGDPTLKLLNLVFSIIFSFLYSGSSGIFWFTFTVELL